MTDAPDRTARRAPRDPPARAHGARGRARRGLRGGRARCASTTSSSGSLADEAAELGLTEPEVEIIGGVDGDDAADDCELAVVIGGDGTILRAAEATHAHGTPLLGVNLGHVGFLAEAESDDLDFTIDAIVTRRYTAEDRLTIDVAVYQDGEQVTSTWALNEASVEKAARERMLEVVVEIDGRPLSRWGCDGVVCATPTGSHGLQLLRRGTGGLARRRGTADGADQRARAVRPAAGGGPDQRARGRGADQHRERGRAVVRRPPDGRAPARCPDRGTPRRARRCGWPGCTRRRSPTGWWPSSASRSTAGGAPRSAGARTTAATRDRGAADPLAGRDRRVGARARARASA